MVTTEEILFKAVRVFRSLTSAKDDELYDALIKAGIVPEMALRLIEFLPIAYSRLILAASGARFPSVYHRALANGSFEEKALSSEPVWGAAVAFAERESETGVSAQDLLAIAGRSAEFHAANQLLQAGSKLENLRFQPTLFTLISE